MNKRVNFVIDCKVHKEFSKICGRLNIVMSEYLEEDMLKFIRRYKKKELIE